MSWLKSFSGADCRHRSHPAGPSVLSAIVGVLLMFSAVGCGGGSDDSKLGVAPGDQPDFAPSNLPDFFGVDHIGLAGGFGWLILDGDASTLWRVAQDGSVIQAPSLLSNFSVTNVGRLGGGLVLSGIRCNGPTSKGGCESSAGIVRLVEPDGRQRWEVEIWSVDGQTGDQEAVPIVGATGNELWATSRDGELVAISPEGKVFRRLPPVVGDPCLLNGSVYALSLESLLDLEAGDPQVPPTASADLDGNGKLIPKEQTFVVQEPNKNGWQIIEGSRETVSGGNVLGQCADGGFEILIDGQPAQHWTVGGGGWEPLPPAAPDNSVGGSEAFTVDGGTFHLDAATGTVVRRTIGSTYASTGIVFEFAIDETGPGVGLLVAAEDQLVFACAVTLTDDTGQSACSFGRDSS